MTERHPKADELLCDAYAAEYKMQNGRLKQSTALLYEKGENDERIYRRIE